MSIFPVYKIIIIFKQGFIIISTKYLCTRNFVITVPPVACFTKEGNIILVKRPQ